MNKIHSFAKIILAAIGIFFAIRIMPQMLMPLGLARIKPSVESTVIALVSTLFFGLCLAVIFYVFVYKREQLARKIVGTNELPEPDSQIQWLPVAFRLISITAGLYCLHTALWQITNTFIRIAMYKVRSVPGYKTIYTGYTGNIEEVLVWLIMLTIGIYLLCGAPHFVRWQVKKTLEECKQQIGLKENQ